MTNYEYYLLIYVIELKALNTARPNFGFVNEVTNDSFLKEVKTKKYNLM